MGATSTKYVTRQRAIDLLVQAVAFGNETLLETLLNTLAESGQACGVSMLNRYVVNDELAKEKDD
jgi:hypothetical protein